MYRRRQIQPISLLIFFTLIPTMSAAWWSLALPSFQFWSSPQTIQEPFCSSLTFLTAEQRAYCQNNPKIFSIITRSLRLAIEECQYQFRNQRWNCSIFNQSEIFGKLSMRKTPETAFIYALTSASVMHSVAKACAKGELSECGCEKNQISTSSLSSSSSSSPLPSNVALRSRILSKTTISSSTALPSINDGFEWGGCSDDLKFGRNVSQSFVDEQESSITRRRIVRMVNLHNNEAG